MNNLSRRDLQGKTTALYSMPVELRGCQGLKNWLKNWNTSKFCARKLPFADSPPTAATRKRRWAEQVVKDLELKVCGCWMLVIQRR